MYIGLLEIDGLVYGSSSLKDKRRVIQSAQTKLRNQFNLSVSEVGKQDDRQFTSIAIVGVGSSKRVVEQELNQALQLLERIDELEVSDAVITFV